jgi:hypothetical protein
VRERRTIPGLLLIGLLAAAILLAGFDLAPGSLGASQATGLQSKAPTTGQIAALQQGEAAFSHAVESSKSQMGPEATAGQNAAILAAETLLLSQGPYVVDMPLVVK